MNILLTKEREKEYKMKFSKTNCLRVAAAVMFFAAQGAVAAGITGTKHDLSATFGGGQICNACHAPHNTTSTSLLWNHTASTATYTLYSSSSLNASVAQPGSVSKLCLSCHDGTVAVDSFGGATGATGAMISGSALVGTDLSNDHPIGFAYTAALATADGGLTSPASLSSVAANVPLYGGTGQMECATCHDVHNTAGIAKLLRKTNASSALCTTCHIK